MSKKKSSAGTTVNPAATPSTTTATAAAAVASAKTTAGPARTSAPPARAAAQVIPLAATNEEGDSSDALRAELMDSLGIGSEESTPPQTKPKAQAEAAPMDEDEDGEGFADETPVSDEAPPADENTSGEDTGDTEDEAGDTESDELEPTADAEPADDGAEATEDDEALDALARERNWPKSYLRRLKKEKARARSEITEREEQIAQLKSENEQLRADPAAAKVAATSHEQALTTEIASLETVLDFVDDHPEGGSTPDGREWTREQLRVERRKAERALREKESELLGVKQQRSAKAREVETMLPQRHPALKDRTSEHSRALDTLLRNFPMLKSEPVLRLMASDALAFELLRQKVSARGASGNGNGNGNGHTGRESAPAAAAAAAPRPASRPPGKPKAQAPTVSPQRVASEAARKTFMETGDPAAGKALIESMLGDD